MYISNLILSNYRNYTRLKLDFPAKPILLQGKNAQGKTNLLEAIYLLSTTTSTYARKDDQLLNWHTMKEDVMPFARLEVTIVRHDETLQLAITIIREYERFKKEIRLNGSKKRAMDVIGQLNTVMFVPEDINLITGSPSTRRRYLDSVLCQIDSEYCRSLSRYNKVVSQRNALLKELNEGKRSIDQLIYWDEQLITHGSIIIIRRHDALLTLATVAHQRHLDLTEESERLRLSYLPKVNPHGDSADEKQIIPAPPIDDVQATFKTQLLASRNDDIIRGMTLLGPHRDDFQFLIDGVDIAFYGSRGQQRTAILSTKLAEVQLMKEKSGDTPVLLLDDVMSELDSERRTQITTLTKLVDQSFLTATDWNDYDITFRQNATCYTIQNGRLEHAQFGEDIFN
ncbi:MAG: DNA replication/repair protein RecF [Anaerolineaceae bacterium 4572_78]|nr:MAG: DNA replication/repair protein RecF [Anaerolineaceae bacterium 4572_78]